MTEVEIVEKIAQLEQKVGYLEKQTSAMNELLEKVVEIGIKLDHLTEQLKDFSIRLGEIEKQPADKWGILVKGLITAGVGALIGFVATKLGG